MKIQFDRSDLKTALSKFARVAEGQIVLSEDVPEIVGTTQAVARPAKTGRTRGSKNTIQTALPLEVKNG